MRWYWIVLLVVVLFFVLSGVVGFFVKKKERVIMSEFKDARDRVSRGKKAYKGAKKKYGKVPKIVVKK